MTNETHEVKKCVIDESRPEMSEDYSISVDKYQVKSDDDDVRPTMDQLSSSDIRGISINPLSSGYMVKVGCQSVAVESTEKLIDMLSKYLTNPNDFERKWYSKNTRNRLENI